MTNIHNFNIKETTSLPNNEGQKIKFIDFPDTVICIYINSKDEFLCIEQYRPVFNETFIEFPGGSIEEGETIEECGIREFIEETGFIPIEVKKLGTVIPSIGLTTEKIHLLRVKSIQNHNQKKESQIEIKWFDYESMCEMVDKGIIKDAKTIIGLYLSANKKNKL